MFTDAQQLGKNAMLTINGTSITSTSNTIDNKPTVLLFKKTDENTVPNKQAENQKKQRRAVFSYWFPILCALTVIFIAIWVAFIYTPSSHKVLIIPQIPEPVVQAVDTNTVPSFDIARIEKNGNIVIACVNNEFTVKYLKVKNNIVSLVAANPKYPEIVFTDGMELKIFGVVTSCIHRFVK